MKRLAKILRWSSSDKLLLLEVFLTVLLVRMALSVIPYRRIDARVRRVGSDTAPHSSDKTETIKKVAKFVHQTSGYIPNASCLTQAIATSLILRRRNVDAVIKFGVDLDQRALSAHAWVEVDGKIVLGKLRDFGRYKVLLTRGGVNV